MNTLINIKFKMASCYLYLHLPSPPPLSPADLLPRSAETFSFSKKTYKGVSR